VDALLILSLMWMGILLGIYVTPLIHDHRIRELSDVQYVAMHQMRDKTFAKVMPPLALFVMALVVLSVALALSPGASQALGVMAVALLVVDIVFTVRCQVPINRQIQSWTGPSIPVEWARLRDTWARQHHLRLVLALLSCAAFSGAVLLASRH
jgi:hypothetical protein